jgi:cytosine/adenosine deaminase-related metal-dependent hydrolase
VHAAVFRSAVRLSRERRLPLAMHLAESREELELLDAGRGPLVERLRELDAWYPDAFSRGASPADYLRILSRAFRALVVHGNYLTRAEFAFLAEHSERMSVVYCPRTHRYFGHAPYPLAQMLETGVRVALGTDSRASNPDLDLWQEMRTVAREHADVSPAAVLELGTIHGARALGLESRLGSVEPGKAARFALVPLPEDASGDPYEVLFGAGQDAAGVHYPRSFDGV